MSSDGRYLAFVSAATNLVPGKFSTPNDVFVKDIVTGKVSLVSVTKEGVTGDGASASPSISGNGRFIAFWSSASNLTVPKGRGLGQILVKDMAKGDIACVSMNEAGEEGNSTSHAPSISEDGRYI